MKIRPEKLISMKYLKANDNDNFVLKKEHSYFLPSSTSNEVM